MSSPLEQALMEKIRRNDLPLQSPTGQKLLENSIGALSGYEVPELLAALGSIRSVPAAWMKLKGYIPDPLLDTMGQNQ